MGNFSVSSSGNTSPLFRSQGGAVPPDLDSFTETGDSEPDARMGRDGAAPTSKGNASQLGTGALDEAVRGGHRGPPQQHLQPLLRPPEA